MFRVLQKLKIAGTYSISVEGDVKNLKNGIKLKDENGNIFVVNSIGMVNYKNIKDFEKFAELLLTGDAENIGEKLDLVK